MREPEFELSQVERGSDPAFGAPAASGRLRLSDTYLLLLANLTDHTVRAVRINGGSWMWLHRPILRTCASTDHDECFEQKAWMPLVHVDGGGSYDVELLLVDGAGQWNTARLAGMSTDPRFRAGLLWLTP